MNELERLAGRYASAVLSLKETLTDFDKAVAAAHAKYDPAITALALRLADARAQLEGEIEDHPELFSKPKTVTLHGVRVGLKKMKGRISWASASKVLALIKKQFPGRRDLIRIKETPNKDALVNLPAAALKRLGCEVSKAGDAPYIKLLDTEAEKFVEGFLATLDVPRDKEAAA